MLVHFFNTLKAYIITLRLLNPTAVLFMFFIIIITILFITLITYL